MQLSDSVPTQQVFPIDALGLALWKPFGELVERSFESENQH